MVAAVDSDGNNNPGTLVASSDVLIENVLYDMHLQHSEQGNWEVAEEAMRAVQFLRAGAFFMN